MIISVIKMPAYYYQYKYINIKKPVTLYDGLT